jgi:hypothetical protein
MGRRLIGLLLVVAIVAVGVIFRTEIVDAIEGWSTRLRDVAAAEPSTEVGLRSVEGESASVLLVVGSAEEDAAFALLVADPTGPSLLVLLPQDLLLAVPGFGEFRIVDALVFGGPSLAALTVTNQFGTRIDSVAAVPAGGVAAGLLESLVVDLPVPLFTEDASGGVVRTLAAGESRIVPELVETLLVEQGEGDVFEWIQRQGAAWRSVLDAIATEPRVADRITADAGPGGPAAADLLLTVAADPDRIIATIPVSRADSSMGIPSLVPTRNQIDQFVQDRFDHLLIRPGGRTRVEILNGNGRIGTTATVAEILVRAGYRVIRTDNADTFEYDETLVIAQGSGAERAAREIVELLGRGLLFLEDQAPSGVVDVSIIVGQDIPSGEG